MENEKRLIDANALEAAITVDYYEHFTQCHDTDQIALIDMVREVIGNAPTVDAVVLPCKIGDMVYVITYCRCGRPECYENQHCYKKETVRTPKVLARKIVQQLAWKNVWNMFGGVDKIKSGWQPTGTICYRVYQKSFELKMLAEVGKTVFLTLEDAEKALEERE